MPLPHPLRPTADEAPDRVPVRLLTRAQLQLLVLIGAVLLAATCTVVLGPGRGARQDIASMTTDLDASRDGIFLQLDTARTQLHATEQSLTIQQQGLQVAVAAEHDARDAAAATRQVLAQTRQALRLVQEVLRSLGPLDQLGGKLDAVVEGVAQGVRLAGTTLRVAEQTLSTGQQALVVAQDTLATLKRSEQVQVQLLRTAQATLEQTREINRKIPGLPVLPTAAP